MFYCRAWCGGSHPVFEAAGNSFPLPNPTQYGRHTHSSFKQTKAAHNDQPCHYGRLIWSGPGHCGFIFFYAHIDVSQPQYASQACMCVCMCMSVSIQTNGDSLGQRACSTACPLIAIYILAESLISNSPIICHPTSPTHPMLVSMSGSVSVILAWKAHAQLSSSLHPYTRWSYYHYHKGSPWNQCWFG